MESETSDLVKLVKKLGLNWSGLINICLRDNQLRSLPPEVKFWTNLTYIDLYGCDLTLISRRITCDQNRQHP